METTKEKVHEYRLSLWRWNPVWSIDTFLEKNEDQIMADWEEVKYKGDFYDRSTQKASDIMTEFYFIYIGDKTKLKHLNDGAGIDPQTY